MTTVSSSSFNVSSDQEREDCSYLQVYGAVWQETYLTDQTYSNLLAIICINLLSVVPIILLNALVIFVVIRKRRLRTNMNILLASLAGADLLTGLVVYPVVIAVDMKLILGVEPFCTLVILCAIAMAITSFASLSHLALISADRYIAIKHPLRYQDIVSKERLKIGVLFIWAITVIVALGEITFAALIDDDLSIYMIAKDSILTSISLVYIAIIIHCNRYIFSETQRHKKRIRTEQLTHEEAKRIKKNYKAANTLVIILAALSLTYFPAIICVLLVASDITIKPHVTYLLWSWCLTFITLGSLLNPVIYSWRSKKLRRAMLDVLRFRQLENRPPDTEITETQRDHGSEIQISTCADDKNQFRSESRSEFCLRKTEADIVDIEEETVK